MGCSEEEGERSFSNIIFTHQPGCRFGPVCYAQHLSLYAWKLICVCPKPKFRFKRWIFSASPLKALQWRGSKQLQTHIDVYGTIFRLEKMGPGLSLSYGFPGKRLQLPPCSLQICTCLWGFVCNLRAAPMGTRPSSWAGFVGLELERTAGWEINQIKDSVCFFTSTKRSHWPV